MLSPTNIAVDVPLVSYGEDQACQLAVRLATLDPPIDRVYSSPMTRCLQTLKPAVESLLGNVDDGKDDGKRNGDGDEAVIGEQKSIRIWNGKWNGEVRVEHGLG